MNLSKTREMKLFLTFIFLSLLFVDSFGVDFSEYNEWNVGQWIIVSIVMVLFIIYLIVLFSLCCKCTNKRMKKGSTVFSNYENNDRIEMTGNRMVQQNIRRSVDV